MDLDDSSLLTVADWRAVTRAGRDVCGVLRRRWRRVIESSPANAWIVRIDEAALERRLAELADWRQTVAEGRTALERWPLFGVPFAVKDNVDVAGLPTTAACPAFSREAAAHATAVRRLLDAGAVLLGKTNLDQFATGLVGTRSPYGAPASVFDAARISGGSSSGSAVVVARGDVAFALGTDTAGSGRIPAGFNQVVGVKPTPGRVSTAGVVPACRSLDCLSILALDVDDGASVLAVIEGADAADPYSRFEPGPATCRAGAGASLRVGVPPRPTFGTTPGYEAAWEHSVQRLRSLGHTTVPIDFEPLAEVAAMLYDGPWVAERWVVIEPLMQRDPSAIDATVRAVVERGRDVSAADAFRAQYALRARQRDLERLWRDIDVLMVPTAPEHPRFDEVAADPVGANARLGRYTNFVNLLGWCALALPSSRTDGGLPFGVTFIAPGGHDSALIDFGRRWQAAVDAPMGATGRRPGAAPVASGAVEGRGRLQPQVRPGLPIAVVGAHLSGQPLNAQLVERGAVLLEATRTAPAYRLHALAGTVPPKPGLQRVPRGGVAIDVEVWSMPQEHVGSFLALVPPPLAIGSIELADGRWCHGFVCEPWALDGAEDISAYGGWRGFLAARAAAPAGPMTPGATTALVSASAQSE